MTSLIEIHNWTGMSSLQYMYTIQYKFNFVLPMIDYPSEIDRYLLRIDSGCLM